MCGALRRTALGINQYEARCVHIWLCGQTAISMTERVAVIGGGAAGLSAGYFLRRDYEVTLFEKQSRVGGNAFTFTTNDGLEADIAVAVFGRAGYKNFFRLLGELGIPTRSAAGRSISVHDLDTQKGVYITRNLRGLRAQHFDLLRPSRLRSFMRLGRGLAVARKIHKGKGFGDLTLREALSSIPQLSGDSETILLCVLCLVSSMSGEEVLETPARFFFDKLEVHNDVVSLKSFYSMRLVPGGTRRYVSALAQSFDGRIVCDAKIERVIRDDDGVRIVFADGESATFDKVIFGCNPDQALALLDAPTPLEQELLSAWRYKDGRLVVHRDYSSFPQWDLIQAFTFLYRRHDGEFSTSVNGSLRFEPGMPKSCDLIGSQHPNFPIRDDLIEFDTVLRTPIFDFRSCATTARLPQLNGAQNTYFCGSYFGHGLHEDAISSALAVAESLGVDPWV